MPERLVGSAGVWRGQKRTLTPALPDATPVPDDVHRSVPDGPPDDGNATNGGEHR
ncbi:hypothetical protein HSBGL_1825 [Halapricum desulfuricans]|uniref:Uncharacterized protein n=1 Tax=Halapricum desulfuricans TaxID=2841257 RepID=A0A897NPX4_9EURY|nr:hypothetical protein [Halapricum desulfuricans]QSG12236.1 hypothetical protein HSBGL_1825 [Halapricum desulfuricans]